MRLALLPSFLMLATPAGAAPPDAMPTVLRVGLVTARDSACAVPGKDTPPALADYARHLAGRLQLPVQLCGFSRPVAIAEAFARGALDFAPLTPATYPAAQGKARPILTFRAPGILPRTPIVAIARTSARMTAAEIARHRIVLVNNSPLAHDRALVAITGRAGGSSLRAPATVAGSFAAAAGALSSGRSDVMLAPIDLWATACAASATACASLHVVWQDWPVADMAWCLRQGLGNELRFRLIGIMLPLRQENPAAFAGAAGRTDGGFEPTEATALAIGVARG
jgi:ABC-type nitrate/sulfonate/bicarbonate transport system substrate-binding protein